MLGLPHCVGDFVIEGGTLVAVSSATELDERAKRRLRDAIAIGEQRSVDQDVAFGFRQIVDIALKALSPAVNDPTTATSCVDYLAALLTMLSQRRFPSRKRYVDGQLRVVAAAPSFRSLVALAVDQLIAASHDQPAVQQRLVHALALAGRATGSAVRRQVLLAPLKRIPVAAEDIDDDPGRESLRVLIADVTGIDAAKAADGSRTSTRRAGSAQAP